MVNLAFIIVHYTGVKDTKECLQSLAASGIRPNHIVILVDNSPTGELEKFLITLRIKTMYLPYPENIGFAEGNNKALHEAVRQKADFCVLLNSDTLVEKNFIENIEAAARNEILKIYSPKIFFASGNEYHKNKYKEEDLGNVIWYAGGMIDWKNLIVSHRGVDEVDKGQFSEQLQTEFATGCCMIIKREVLEKVGLFDKNYFVYYEDVDYSYRAQKAGFKIFFVPDIKLWHKNAASSGKPGSLLHQYFQSRNRLYFGLKYAPLKTRLHLLKNSLSDAIGSNKTGKQALYDYFTHNLGKGSFDGI